MGQKEAKVIIGGSMNLVGQFYLARSLSSFIAAILKRRFYLYLLFSWPNNHIRMEMEVIIPSRDMDFDFNSARSSPYATAPSTPRRFGDYYFSAPSSPTRVSQFYRDFDGPFGSNNGRASVSVSVSPPAVPFDWEEKPGKPKSRIPEAKLEIDFAFDVGQESEKNSLSAEELFDGGVIRPLRLPPAVEIPARGRIGAPRSPKSPAKKMIKQALNFSPKQRKPSDGPDPQRGRERVPSNSSPNAVRRSARSVSPLRISKYPWEEEEEEDSEQSTTNSKLITSSASSKIQKKWSLKDFFLFRSASEGRAYDRDPLKKHAALFRKHEAMKKLSFREIERHGSSSRRRRTAAVSIHELHYTVNRAVSEDLKKKTFLPYKQGILGRLAFNPAVHALSNGFGFSRK